MALGWTGLSNVLSAAASAMGQTQKNNKNTAFSGGSYRYTDSDGRSRTSNQSTDWAAQYYNAMRSGDLAGAQTALDMRALKMGGDTDSWQGQAQQTLSNYRTNLQQPAQNVQDTYTSRTDAALAQYAAQQQAILQEQQARVEANIAELNAQKPLVQQAGVQANRAAQQQYMNVLNPNGANAEQLAALGLTQSGMSESAAISAGNAYMQAVNANEQNVSNQLAAIDLAITQAQLSGDIAAAQQMQEYYNTVLAAGLEQAQNIASYGQWGLENAQQQTQQGLDNLYTQAGLTGTLFGQPTMEGQQLSYTLEGMDLENQLQQFALLLQQTYGMDREAAELEAQRIANEGAALEMQGQWLENEYQRLYNTYFRRVNWL